MSRPMVGTAHVVGTKIASGVLRRVTETDSWRNWNDSWRMRIASRVVLVTEILSWPLRVASWPLQAVGTTV
jgi:hypothetical protein